MQLSLSIGRRSCPPGVDLRAQKLHSVLLAARRTDFYARRLKGIRLGTPEAAAALSPVEMALAALPPIPLRMFLDNREHFENAGSRRSAAAMNLIQAIPNGWRAKLGFRAEALAGPQSELAELAARVEEGEEVPARHARRLIVYTRIGDRPLTASLRNRLWDAFELPVFEQLHGLEGELLASECDAHEGMHLETDSAVFENLDGELVVTSLLASRVPVLRLRTGLAGSIACGACPCGAEVARFLPAPEAAADRKPPSIARDLRAAQHRLAAAL